LESDVKDKKEQNKAFFKLVLSISRSLMSLIRNSYRIFEVIWIFHRMNNFSICQINSHDTDCLLVNSLLIDSFFKISKLHTSFSELNISYSMKRILISIWFRLCFSITFHNKFAFKKGNSFSYSKYQSNHIRNQVFIISLPYSFHWDLRDITWWLSKMLSGTTASVFGLF
jgi:hypothetical protein